MAIQPLEPDPRCPSPEVSRTATPRRAPFRAAAREAGGAISSFHVAAAPPMRSARAPASHRSTVTKRSTDAAWIGRARRRGSSTRNRNARRRGVLRLRYSDRLAAARTASRAAARYRAAADPRHQPARLCLAAAGDRGQCRSQSQLRRLTPLAIRQCGYEALKHAICPREWTRCRARGRRPHLDGLCAGARPDGAASAISTGQYGHAEGVYYGGRGETWSNRTLAELLRTHAGQVRQVAFIDLHTGLGPTASARS